MFSKCKYFSTFYATLPIYILKTDKKKQSGIASEPLIRIILQMITQKGSVESYPSMVPHDQLEYSIIKHQIILFSEVQISSLSNFLRLFLLKWLIYENGILMFYNNTEQKWNVGDM